MDVFFCAVHMLSICFVKFHQHPSVQFFIHTLWCRIYLYLSHASWKCLDPVAATYSGSPLGPADWPTVSSCLSCWHWKVRWLARFASPHDWIAADTLTLNYQVSAAAVNWKAMTAGILCILLQLWQHHRYQALCVIISLSWTTLKLRCSN